MGQVIIEGGEFLARDGMRANAVLELDTPEGPDVRLALDENDLVLPGLVDIHCHVGAGTLLAGPRSGVARYPFGVSQTECLVSGVVACADAGSFGPLNVRDAALEWAKDPNVAVRSWIFPYGEGIHDPRPIPGAAEMLEELTAVREAIPDVVIGLKIRLGRTEPHEDEVLLDRAITVATALGLPVMVHLTGSHLGADEVCRALRSGDVVTHAFHPRLGGVLDEAGELLAGVGEAQARGVILDVAPGAHHFSFAVLEAALRAGAAPDTISTDLTYLTWCTEPVCILPNVVSQITAVGVPLEQALFRASYRAADLLGVELDVRKGAVVLRREPGEWTLRDSLGEGRRADVVLRVVAVVTAGGRLIDRASDPRLERI